MFGCEPLLIKVKSASESMPEDVDQEAEQRVEMLATPQVSV